MKKTIYQLHISVTFNNIFTYSVCYAYILKNLGEWIEKRWYLLYTAINLNQNFWPELLTRTFLARTSPPVLHPENPLSFPENPLSFPELHLTKGLSRIAWAELLEKYAWAVSLHKERGRFFLWLTFMFSTEVGSISVSSSS